MSAKQAIQVGSRYVKPMLSLSKGEARRRVLNLYKAWYRQIPYIVKDFDMPKTEEQCRDKLKEIFLKNKDVSDIRVIDVLVIKGQMELQECVKIWKQKGHVMAYWKPSEEPKPKDFLSKFFAGNE
ncbi:NADH dehydrogenase [ubiquinone] 1 alpha subcomplex subunit 6 [Plutella xylostella]|uniref:NADH dehydrogenase [ubiquinone] 1 alpha subcomplex subunit 6 n=1 Tax=Plutella xylostella TaxID=51655 RepID=UPI0005D08548|nr:NADH dehydrogenase [ubiquinone] 1 alpha subcomplex subunit 6 [Plutella xylostella]